MARSAQSPIVSRVPGRLDQFVAPNSRPAESDSDTAPRGFAQDPGHGDRPFLFLVRHRPSDAILWLGRVVDPTATALVRR